MRRKSRPLVPVLSITVAALLIVAAVHAQGPKSIPNGAHFPNSNGTSTTYSTAGAVDLTGPFFQSLGTNGRSCGSCHQPSDGMSVSAEHIQQRFDTTAGTDPIFRTVDGSNCDNLDVSTVEARSAAYSLLRTRGLIRIAIGVPANANYTVTSVSNPYGCGNTSTISMYRRPLPAANLRFLSAVMSDGRESTPATATSKISFANYPGSLVSDLKHQALDAANGHAQGNGLTDEQQEEIVNFEMGLFTAQATRNGGGNLDAQGARGGPIPLINQPFFISANSSINVLLPQLEQPGGLVTPGDGRFTSAVFDIFDAWSKLPYPDPRASIARGEALFTSKPIHITGVAGINDDEAAGGLVSGGISSLTGTCGTCHDTPNIGNHSFPTPLNIGVADPGPTSSVNMGGLDISYLPRITACRTDPTTHKPTTDCKTTTDLGQALIDGDYDHIGKLKGPILRGLSSRAPYFHNGSAQNLLDVVRFYEVRFGVSFTAQEEEDLVAFLSSL